MILQMAVAFFDLDHTLLAGDSDQLWGDYLRARGEVDGDFQARKNAFYAAYQRGELDIYAFHRFMLATVKGQRFSALLATQRQFADDKIAPVLRRDGLARLQWHRAQQHATVIITATNRVIAAAAQMLLADCDLIATEPQLRDELITGEIDGIPSFRDGKVLRAEHYCTQRGIALRDCYFYSDSHNDLPLLQAVRYPHAVTPDATLRAHAESNAWPILEWQ
jgi:HAD superfamily hydrolase (TIGR01490 family)